MSLLMRCLDCYSTLEAVVVSVGQSLCLYLFPVVRASLCPLNANRSPRRIVARTGTRLESQTRATPSQTPPASVSGRQSQTPPRAGPRPRGLAVAALACTLCRTWPDRRWAYSLSRTGNAAMRRREGEREERH